jgi:hypothetical protein
MQAVNANVNANINANVNAMQAQAGRCKHHMTMHLVAIMGVHGGSLWQNAFACHCRCTAAVMLMTRQISALVTVTRGFSSVGRALD